MPIENSDITIVVQGLVDNEITKKCIKSIREVLPGSNIILSTWKNSKVEGIDYDKIILNEDPGHYFRRVELIDGKLAKKKVNNINRQIVSTQNGLKAVTTKYSLKLRTDFLITHDQFKNKFETIQSLNIFEKNYQIFKKRVICCQCGTHSVRKGKFYLPFHYSDFAHFGLTVDLLNLFEIPLATMDELTYFEDNKNKQRKKLGQPINIMQNRL